MVCCAAKPSGSPTKAADGNSNALSCPTLLQTMDALLGAMMITHRSIAMRRDGVGERGSSEL
jgi:hypothetical protein